MGGASAETISKAQLTSGLRLREGPLSVDNVSKLAALLSAETAGAAGSEKTSDVGAAKKGTGKSTAGGKGTGKRTGGKKQGQQICQRAEPEAGPIAQVDGSAGDGGGEQDGDDESLPDATREGILKYISFVEEHMKESSGLDAIQKFDKLVTDQ